MENLRELSNEELEAKWNEAFEVSRGYGKYSDVSVKNAFRITKLIDIEIQYRQGLEATQKGGDN